MKISELEKMGFLDEFDLSFKALRRHITKRLLKEKDEPGYMNGDYEKVFLTVEFKGLNSPDGRCGIGIKLKTAEQYRQLKELEDPSIFADPV